MDFIFGIRPARRFAIKPSCNFDHTPSRMFFPLSGPFRGTVSLRFISIRAQGANKTALAGLALPSAPLLATPRYQRTGKMSRDVSSQSDIGKMTVEPDGSFKRAPSSFRSSIRKGGDFPPEKGAAAESLSVRILNPPPLTDRYHLYVSYACREQSAERGRTRTDRRPPCSLGDEDPDHPKAQGSR
jgi:hypothetical protein